MIRQENISFDQCIKCTICTAYCPVAKATTNFPGPKHSGPDAERLRIKDPHLVESSLKYCTNCKKCETVCPSDVKIAGIIQEAKSKYMKMGFFRPRDFFMSHTDLIGPVAVRISMILNLVLKFPVTKALMDLFLRIPFSRSFPSYGSGAFADYYKKNEASKQQAFSEKVVYFTGCYVNYNNHSLGMDVIKVMNAFGKGVELSYENCCGVPLIANGYLVKAKKNALRNIKNLEKTSPEKRIISSSSSCAFALKYEYSDFLKLDNSRIFNRIDYITRYIYFIMENEKSPKLKKINIRVAYHAPCHLERMGGVLLTIALLKRIPGLQLIILDAECCGIAGTYGFKKEYYNVSQKIGGQLFKKIEDADPEFVVTDCETCSMQITMNTQYKVLHPVSLLAMSL